MGASSLREPEAASVVAGPALEETCLSPYLCHSVAERSWAVRSGFWDSVFSSVKWEE